MPPLTNKIRVAMFDHFLDAFAQLNRAQQRKVNQFVRKFRRDPTAASIDYEKISTFTDPNLRTVRIDQTYRAVVLKPRQGNVYVLLWVDHHDKAHQWAENKTFDIHPETGALQVLTHTEVVAPRPIEAAPDDALYDGLRDRELLRLGVPEPMLAEVRRLQSLSRLEALAGRLPDEAYEALWFLGEGETLEEVERAMAVKPPEEVDTDDFAAALDRPDSRRRFVLVDDDDALAAMLDAPLEKWRVFLHPSQRRLVNRTWNGPVRVLGGAGTGKTVVALHRAAWLARECYTEPGDRVLFTTFTRNLAADIRAQLAKLGGPDVQRRIEVVHLDKWTADLLERAGYDYTIAYWNGRTRASRKMHEAWEEALTMRPEQADFSDAFYRQEWEQVVQPHGCTSFNDYKKVLRQGRGSGLNRSQRKAIWPVFEEYRALLERHGLRERVGALRDALTLIRTGTPAPRYRAVLVDEAQDMSTVAFELLRASVPEGENDMFIVGDGHQRIYSRRVVLSHAGVHIVGRSHRLRVNYRTTDEIRKFAVGLLEGRHVEDLDGGVDTTDGYKSLMHGDKPDVIVVDDFEKEIDVIHGWLQEGRMREATCLVARTSSLRDQYAERLRARGVDTYELRRSEPEDPNREGLRVATMHRVKGLEFDHVILAGVDRDTVPLKMALEAADDDATREDVETMERALAYVAVTRARKGVLVTASKALSELF